MRADWKRIAIPLMLCLLLEQKQNFRKSLNRCFVVRKPKKYKFRRLLHVDYFNDDLFLQFFSVELVMDGKECEFYSGGGFDEVQI
jgi:hypothetical protein